MSKRQTNWPLLQNQGYVDRDKYQLKNKNYLQRLINQWKATMVHMLI